ncbi:hypothetical protein O9G_001561 [Rozella allomycis CSF55]|uniref:Ribosome assembly factor mrt4 n=1 Tax=Rozella allomycis (strain CSF55) TaxID=988480 RepID=A0A075B2K0_ROZAC|nr:hypothetical protein O9G_001561 [Rozella allomycis CSF55]|eukprot:EPZ36577.1 hypothetical protein O9G_001561 [Rozella allomycis CSF55]
MPKSKRSKSVVLTQTKKKGNDNKINLIEEVRKCIDEYPIIYLIKVKNMRNQYLKEVRTDWKGSRFFFGKNRVMAKALGTTEDEAIHENLHILANKLTGDVGLLFSSTKPEEAKNYFEGKTETDYARTGQIATETVVLPSGPVLIAGDAFPHSMEPQLKSLGVTSSLKNGVVINECDYTICKEGDVLTSSQARLLKMFCIPMSEFRVDVLGYYSEGKYYDL